MYKYLSKYYLGGIESQQQAILLLEIIVTTIAVITNFTSVDKQSIENSININRK